MARKTTGISSLAEMLNDASIDRILAIDRNWQIIAWNKASENVSGIQRAEIIGKPLLEIFPFLRSDQEIIAAFERGLQGFVSFLPSRQGFFHRSYYENHFMPLLDEDGQSAGVMNIMHDVSHRLKAEKQLEKLNIELREKFRQLERANAELATFTSITGNDLKEPLRRVYTSLELIMKNDGHKFSDGSKAALRRMQASISRMNILLDDILALSTANTATDEFAQVDTAEILRSVLNSMHKKIDEKNAIVEIERLPSVTGSSQMLQYLFYNLIDNAIKFQCPEQKPKIRVTGGEVTSQSGNGSAENKMIRISITDNGIGFEQADAAHIFTLFTKLPTKQKFPGSGIGLAICRKIMEAHNGFIDVASIPGEGSTFNCYFPDTRTQFPEREP